MYLVIQNNLIVDNNRSFWEHSGALVGNFWPGIIPQSDMFSSFATMMDNSKVSLSVQGRGEGDGAGPVQAGEGGRPGGRPPPGAGAD